MMPDTPSNVLKILFICSRNKWRSVTAECIFDGFNNYEARSAGTQKSARVKVTGGHLGWADLIVVMEKKHKRRIVTDYADILADKQIVCLNIPDKYGLMDPALIERLKVTLRPYLTVPD